MEKKKWLNPSQKRKRFSEQLKSGFVAETGAALTAEQIAYRKGYNQSVYEQQSLYRYKNSSPEDRAKYKEERTAKRAAWRKDHPKNTEG